MTVLYLIKCVTGTGPRPDHWSAEEYISVALTLIFNLENCYN